MDFKSRMEQMIDRGIAGTKDLWDKAKETARDLSQKGILTFEIGQLERQAYGDLSRLGTLVYDALVNKSKPAIYPEDLDVKKLLESVQEQKRRIEAKEEELKKLREKGG